MNEIDTWILIILIYTSIAHLYLEAFEDYTMNTRWITVEVVVILLLFCVMVAIADYSVP